MVDHFTRCDPEYGARVARGIGLEVELLVAKLSEAATARPNGGPHDSAVLERALVSAIGSLS